MESLIQSRDLRAGDDLWFLSEPHRVVAIEPYDGPMAKYGCFAMARCREDWTFGLYEGQTIEAER